MVSIMTSIGSPTKVAVSVYKVPPYLPMTWQSITFNKSHQYVAMIGRGCLDDSVIVAVAARNVHNLRYAFVEKKQQFGLHCFEAGSLNGLELELNIAVNDVRRAFDSIADRLLWGTRFGEDLASRISHQ